MTMLNIMIVVCVLTNGLAVASESLTLQSETGDTLMVHRLDNGELWGSFMITDQVVASFADHELIVLQVDQHKPIKLDQAKRCGGGKGDESQQVTYAFDAEQSQEQWQFNRVETVKPDILKLAGWDKAVYQHMTSDRRPEVVDFPINGSLAIAGLWQQFSQSNKVIFRYVTDKGEQRQAEFDLRLKRDEMLKL